MNLNDICGVIFLDGAFFLVAWQLCKNGQLYSVNYGTYLKRAEVSILAFSFLFFLREGEREREVVNHCCLAVLKELSVHILDACTECFISVGARQAVLVTVST